MFSEDSLDENLNKILQECIVPEGGKYMTVNTHIEKAYNKAWKERRKLPESIMIEWQGMTAYSNILIDIGWDVYLEKNNFTGREKVVAITPDKCYYGTADYVNTKYITQLRQMHPQKEYKNYALREQAKLNTFPTDLDKLEISDLLEAISTRVRKETPQSKPKHKRSAMVLEFIQKVKDAA